MERADHEKNRDVSCSGLFAWKCKRQKEGHNTRWSE